MTESLNAFQWNRHILDTLRLQTGWNRSDPRLAARYVFFEELRLGTGYGYFSAGGEWTTEQRIDAWMMDTWPSGGLAKTSYEVKVSRGDLLRELKKPAKRAAAVAYSDYFYFVTPPGLMKAGELPPEAGLLEVDAGGVLQYRNRAPRRKALEPTWLLFASLARRKKYS